MAPSISLPAGSYSGIVRCGTIVLDNSIIGGATVACRCGAGSWYESREAADRAAAEHKAANAAPRHFGRIGDGATACGYLLGREQSAFRAITIAPERVTCEPCARIVS